MKKLRTDSHGMTQLALVIVGIVVLASIGFVAWRIVDKEKVEDAAKSTSEKLNAECTDNDKDICKFFASYKALDTFKVDVVSIGADGKKSTALFESDGKDRTRILNSGENANLEMIIIGKATYTKAANGTWWKQMQEDDKPSDRGELYKSALKEPTADAPGSEQFQYKKLGTEACGDLTCFKYQVIDPKQHGQTLLIWFDTKDYQLRRQTIEDKDSKSEQTFTYTGITIKEPSPVRELGPNQILIPGQAEPMTLPAAP